MSQKLQHLAMLNTNRNGSERMEMEGMVPERRGSGQPSLTCTQNIKGTLGMKVSEA